LGLESLEVYCGRCEWKEEVGEIRNVVERIRVQSIGNIRELRRQV
jgi:hypothetical protein